jgi:hypothetical protein
MDEASAAAELPPAPDLRRDLIARDLDLLAGILDRAMSRQLPALSGLLRMATGSDSRAAILSALSGALLRSDDELALLIDAAAHELGAYRGQRAPITAGTIEANPALGAALAGLVDSL